MPNHTSPSPVWLFDLDNTLHDASHAIFPAISANMNTYIARVLGDGATPASQDVVDAARLGYWKRYGATLLGMIRHHQVCPKDFLHVTHDLQELQKLVRAEKGLGALLRRLPGRKILLTNAPTRYSTDVMRHLGLGRHFSHHVAIEHMHVHRQLRPKPSSLMLRRLLRKHGVAARRCILVEDTLANLKSASRLGVRTVWVTQYLRMSDPIGKASLPRTLKRPGYVDVKVKSVRQLPARLHRLR
ncbi:HAD-IA family hydrolase [Massilia yuzhufengensis]|uniref:Putative hydrolase of the HAD superfamily n=1 Tax=Massilia yuzhufengensis TaxID=1164594 RepID=A0A1I1DDA7_9BURK|nr:HAD-IA family hydrolase [Massilia yuzhufengensis]SFB72935.1 putative hydrolase of the HAD superfamily [Massilia yuzhufengensis]